MGKGTDYPGNRPHIGRDNFQVGALTIKTHDESFSESFEL